MIDHMWDAETGYAYALYYDLSKKMMKTCDLFAGLYVDVFPREIVRQLMATLEREFMTEYGLTSASRLEPTFDPDNMARGPVWIFMNYCVYHAARLHDQHALADRILAGTLRLMKEFPGVYESINPTTRALARTKVGPICYPRMSFCAAGVVNMLYER
jgi:glycogen debranching enzyme